MGYGHEGLTLPGADFSRDFATSAAFKRNLREKTIFNISSLFA